MAVDVTAALVRAAKRQEPVTAFAALAKKHDAATLLRALGSLQDGQFATAQARAFGVGSEAVRWLRQSGQIVGARQRVWRFASAVGQPDAGVTAFLSCWPHGVLSHETAAAFHGLPVTSDSSPHVTVSHDHRGCAPAGVSIHLTRLSLDSDRLWSGTVPYTSLARTVCDLAESRTPWQALTLVDDAVALGASSAWLHSCAGRISAGRGGATLVLHATAPGSAGVFRSWLERTADHVFRVGGLPPPRWNVRIRDTQGLIGIADALFDPWRVIAETEGLRFHTSPAQRKKDAERFNRFDDAGFTARRFTWHDVVERPVYVVTSLARPLIAAGAPVDLARVPRTIEIPDAPFAAGWSGSLGAGPPGT